MFATVIALALTAAPAPQVHCERNPTVAKARHVAACTKAQIAAYDKARFDSMMFVLRVQAASQVAAEAHAQAQAPQGELTPMQVAAQGGPQYAIVHVNGESVHVSYTVGE
jgi:hypothetical protein